MKVLMHVSNASAELGLSAISLTGRAVSGRFRWRLAASLP
jgi:hypothetical protein